MMANISSNANKITIWETRNFSLCYEIDISGDMIKQIAFAPNDKDLVLLTTSSKLKFYRIPQSSNETSPIHIKDSYGVTDNECMNFQISANNRYILCTGKEGVVKVYDYLMRGKIVPNS